MKIMHLIFSFNVGGSEVLLADVIEQQVKNDTVTLLVINDIYHKELLDSIHHKADVILLNRKKGSRNVIDILKLNWHIFRLRPDMIHCHDSNISKYIAFSTLYSTLLTVHGTKLPLEGIRKYKKIIAISKAVHAELTQRNITPTDIVYNGIRTSSISLKEKNYNSGNMFRIVQVGRLEFSKKGQDTSLRAISILKQKHPQCHIHIDFIGIGSSEAYLQQLTTELGISDRVHFLGLKDRDYIYSHLKEYDLLVQPSINEGFGLTVVEGMVAGLPVLVSDIEGPMEVIQDGKYGFAFEVNNAEDMAQKIDFILQHPDIANEMAACGQKYAIENYDISATVNKLEVLYNT